MVTFGQTTTFGSTSTAAPSTGFSFGSTTNTNPAPAATTATTGGLFGGTSTSTASTPASTGFSFGSPAPAPTPGGGLFGNTAAPSTTTTAGGLFGSSNTGSTSGGLFGNNATTTSAATGGGGLFGNTSGSAFGTTTSNATTSGMNAGGSSLFGGGGSSSFGSSTTIQNNSNNNNAVNAQQTAALFAQQQEAFQRAEAQRLEQALVKLHASYNTVNPTTDCRFQHVFFDAADANTVYQYRVMGQRSHYPHVDPKVWAEADAYNPDPEKYIPVSVVGAEQLQSRISSQQAQATVLKEHLSVLRKSLDQAKEHLVKSDAGLQTFTKSQNQLMERMLGVIRKVEVLRCLNVPTQSSERVFRERLNKLQKDADAVRTILEEVMQTAENVKNSRSIEESIEDLSREDMSTLARALRDQKDALEKLKSISIKDARDFEIIKNGISKKLSS